MRVEAAAGRRNPKCGKEPPGGVVRSKRFAEQNLGAGGIHFRRASAITKGWRRLQAAGTQNAAKSRRAGSCAASVLRSKTLAQAEFTSAEQVQSPKGGGGCRPPEPKMRQRAAGRGRAQQAFCGAKPWRRRNSLPPSKCNHQRVEAAAGRRNPKKRTSQ
jgi:hypothetical protein